MKLLHQYTTFKVYILLLYLYYSLRYINSQCNLIFSQHHTQQMPLRFNNGNRRIMAYK